MGEPSDGYKHIPAGLCGLTEWSRAFLYDIYSNYVYFPCERMTKMLTHSDGHDGSVTTALKIKQHSPSGQSCVSTQCARAIIIRRITCSAAL